MIFYEENQQKVLGRTKNQNHCYIFSHSGNPVHKHQWSSQKGVGKICGGFWILQEHVTQCLIPPPAITLIVRAISLLFIVWPFQNKGRERRREGKKEEREKTKNTFLAVRERKIKIWAFFCSLEKTAFCTQYGAWYKEPRGIMNSRYFLVFHYAFPETFYRWAVALPLTETYHLSV